MGQSWHPRPPRSRNIAAATAALALIALAACGPTPAPAPVAHAPRPAPPPTSAPIASVTATATVAPAPVADPPPAPPPLIPDKVPCDQPTGLALALLIDRSGSMMGQPIEMAKAAAKTAAAKLQDSDYLEVVGFDSQAVRVARTSAGQRPSSSSVTIAIDRIQAGGGTEIFPALDKAYQDLSIVEACRKHVLLLTDGMSPTYGIRDLVATMISESITVSAIGLGTSVDEQLLKMITDVGGGRYRGVTDPTQLPAVFSAEVELVEKEIERSR